MELLDRYLQAVRGYLLRGRRDDIVKELGDNILSQMEDKASELGRPLTEAEQTEILKQHGHPLLAAARYGRLPMQHLIGPALFPVYWYVLLAVLALITAIHVIMGMVLIITSRFPLGALMTTWGLFWVWIMVGVGGVTICFGLIEYLGGGKVPFTNTFDPRQLPELKKSAPRGSNSIVELILGSLFIVGWLIFLHAPSPAFTAAIPFRLAPVWWRFEAPMILTVALGMAAAYAHLFHPRIPLLRTVLRLASDVAGVITFYFFLGASEFIILQADMAAKSTPVRIGDHLLTTAQVANYAMAIGPCIAFIVFFVDGLVETIRLVRSKQLAALGTHQPNAIF
ncbi:MAG TPA: hypothetical protein VEW69_09690 [Alphaproteobacteria bacterium]|nr:hypothetical protein [Alphaproteobacteria bacterium]